MVFASGGAEAVENMGTKNESGAFRKTFIRENIMKYSIYSENFIWTLSNAIAVVKSCRTHENIDLRFNPQIGSNFL